LNRVSKSKLVLPAEKHAGEVFAHAQTFILQASRAAGIALFACFSSASLCCSGFIMSKFPQFDNAKIMIAASVRHCRFTLEDLPVGQIIVDENLQMRAIDVSSANIFGIETAASGHLSRFISPHGKQLPQKLSPAVFGDLGEFYFLAKDAQVLCARVVCVPGHHPHTFLLSIVFSSGK